MRRILLAILLVLSVVPLYARGHLQGWAENGGKSVFTSGLQSTTKVQQSYPGSTVTVYLTGTTTLASIFTNSTGTIKPNPFTSGTDASWGFFVDVAVDIKFSGTGIASPFTLTNLNPSGGGGATNTFDWVTYGADPTGVTDSSVPIQNAFDAACLVSGIVTSPEGTFKINTGISLNCANNKAINFQGSPNNYTGTGGTILKVGTAMSAAFSILSKYSTINYLKVDSNRLANYGIFFNQATLTNLKMVHVANSLLDGIHSNNTGLNQGIICETCVSINNGKTYATAGIIGQYTLGVAPTLIAGTAGIVTANATITVTGGLDITTLGIRVGNAGDMIRVGSVAATAFYGQITAVTHIGAGNDTITLQPSLNGFPLTTVSGQDFAIGIGFGWYEEINSMNGRNLISNASILRGNGGGGLLMNGLYGDRIVFSDVSDNNLCGVAMGLISNNVFLNQPVAEHVYMEFNTGPDYVIGAVGDAKIDTPSGGSALFSIGGGVINTTGIIIRGNVVESITFGKQQDFLVVIQNVGGVIKHQIVSTLTGFASLAAGQVNGESATLAVTPIGASALDATHPFVSGGGIVSGAANFFLLDTPGGYTNNGQIYGSLYIEGQKISSGTQATIPLRSQVDMYASNVNGVTRNRLVFIITNGFTNAAADLSSGANGLPVNGDFIVIRFQGFIK